MIDFEYAKELSKDYERNKVEIFEIIYSYFKEHEKEIAQRMAIEFVKNIPNIKEITCGDENIFIPTNGR